MNLWTKHVGIIRVWLHTTLQDNKNKKVHLITLHTRH